MQTTWTRTIGLVAGTMRCGASISGLSDWSGYHPVEICVVSEDGNCTTSLGSQKVKKQNGLILRSNLKA